jgi:hypothetical protein
MTATEPASAWRGRRAGLTLLLLAGGLALLVYTWRQLHFGVADVQNGFARVGPWFAAIFALSFARFVLRSYAWMTLTARPAPLAAAVAATISGDALGNVTPLGLAASEPAKAFYLRRYGNPADLLASLTAENFFYSVSVAIYIVIGGICMLEYFPVDASVRRAGIVATAAMMVVLGAAAWLAQRQPALVSGMLARVPFARLRALVERVRVFEQRMYDAAGHRGSRLAVVAACELAFHVLSLLECWMTFWLLTGVTALLPALVLDAFGRVVNIVFKSLPFRVGVEESGTAVLAQAIGYARDGGFLLGLIRKARVIAWAAVGLVLWARNAGAATDARSSARSSTAS